jgi:UrcA family protein
MKSKVRVLDAILVLAAISAADIAQSAPPPAEQVTRSGPYLVNKTVKTQPYTLPKTITRMSLEIDYRGLDLTSDGDVARLETRVRQAAADICGQLAQRHPGWVYHSAGEEKNCTRNTSESALADVRTAVAIARSDRQSAQKGR